MLGPESSKGKHKARFLAAALGLRQKDAGFPREELLAAARQNEAVFVDADQFGEGYEIDRWVGWEEKRAMVRSGWIVRKGEGLRLVIWYEREAKIQLAILSVVALTAALRDKGLRRGQVGTIVENLAPGVYEVEFSDDHGRTYASVAVPADRLMPLYHEAESYAA